jgi:DNA polymerase III subunit delta
MTPAQFVAHLKQQEPARAYLFLGPEPYQRDFCRKALVERVLPSPEERENGFARFDMDETPLEAVIEDARSMSLFASRRLIIASGAEAALPRTRGGASEESEEEGGAGNFAAAALERYLADPSPDVVLVFEASRYGFHGDEKKKIERVRKFYAGVRMEVEFAPMDAPHARQFAETLAKRAGLAIGPAELDMLVDALGAEAARIAAEIEKLKLYASGGAKIGAEQIAELVPEARDATIFALVGALGRGDRVKALDILDTLVRHSEYLPLALSFLATQFRFALAAREAGLRSAQQIQGHFSKLGIPMWFSRAQQVQETLASFSPDKLARAVEAVYQADKALRDTRPDDRVVMEDFILRVTA